MKNRIFKLALSFSFLYLLTLLQAQVPEGGIRLNATTGTTFQQIGKCTATATEVTGQTFTQGIQITVQSDITNTWDAQVKFPSIAGIDVNDVLFVAFYARTLSSPQETGEGNVTVIAENNTTYAKDISYTITIGNEWRQYYASVISGSTLTASQISYSFHCGFPEQIIEVADVQFLNYKQTIALEELPVTEITYFGQDPDAAWRAPAEERINQIRKGVADIKIYDAAGQPAGGAGITVEMVQHQFGFGTAIASNEFNSNATYRNKVVELFNEVVFENDLKWPQFNPANTTNITRAMDTLDAHHIPIRGHNVIWPSWKFTPSILETLKDNPVALRNAIDNHIDQVTQFTSGRLNDWDVMNEPYSEHDIQDILGNEVMADWYKRTRQNDRSVKLYINDYSIISSGGKNTVKQDYYYNLIKEIEADGGQIDGIGFQGHFSTELTPITRVYEILERYADLGKEMKITEHDINTTQRGVQADYTRDFMTICFSHSSVKSLLVWGFWAGRHWKPESAFYAEDWSVRPHGEVWSDMIFNKWWTPETTLVADANGETSLEGFLGRYKYTVTLGDEVRSGFFTIDNSNQSGQKNEVIISLDLSIPETVKLSSSVTGFLCEGETTTLAAPEGDGLNYTWYRDGVELPEATPSIETGVAGNYTVKINKSGIVVLSDTLEVVVQDAPVAEMTPAGTSTLCQGETLTLNGNTGEGLSYSWRKNGQQVLGNSDELEVVSSGTYSLITSLNGCKASSDQIVVTVGVKPEATITLSGDNPICEGEKTYLMATIATNIKYNWFRDNVELEKTERLLEVTETGSYTVETSIGDCSTMSDPVNIEVNPIPEAVITVTGALTFCEGSDVTLTGNSGEGLIYTWINGTSILDEAEQTIVVDESGSYSLMTTLENCSATSDPVIVTVLPATDPSCANSIVQREIPSTVYPNPFHGSFILNIPPDNSDEGIVQIINTAGKIVYSEALAPFTEMVQVQIADPGLYLLLIRKGTRMETLKVTGE